MRIKFLSFIASFFMVSFVITSCLDDDNDIEYSPDATIHAFELDTIGYGISYKFTIDQQKGLIYNQDSLPVHADTIIDRILIKTLTTASGVVTMKDKEGRDSIINISDSLDLRKKLEIKVWSTEALAGIAPDKVKTYTIDVGVHKHDPDSLSWGYVGEADNNINIKRQRSIILGAHILTYAETDNELKVYKNSVNELNNWSTANSLAGLESSITTLPTSIIEFKNKLYATFKSDNTVTAYTSEDGITWTKLTTLTGIELFLAPIKDNIDQTKDKISYIKKVSDEKYVFSTSTNGIDEDYAAYDKHKEYLNQKEVKLFPNIITSYTNYENRNGTEGVLLIGESEKATTISDDGKDVEIAVAWGYSEEKLEVEQLSSDGQLVLDEANEPVKVNIIISRWVDLPAGSSNSYCPKLNNPTIIHYNSQFYLFGNEFDSFYVSQSGRDWKKANKKFSFPYQDWSKENNGYDPIKFPEFRGRTNYSMVVDMTKDGLGRANNYLIFIFGKEDNISIKQEENVQYSHDSEIWRARLNQLWFDKDPEHAGQ